MVFEGRGSFFMIPSTFINIFLNIQIKNFIYNIERLNFTRST